jgi:hypothetical protein
MPTGSRVTETARVLVDVSCGVVATVSIAMAVFTTHKLNHPPPQVAHRLKQTERTAPQAAAKVHTVTALVVGAALWPVVFDLTARLETMAAHPRLWLAFLWPLLTIGTDLALATCTSLYGQVLRPLQSPQLGTAEGNAIIGVALAIGSILINSKNARADTKHITLPLLMAGTAMSLAFVLPVPTVQPGSDVHAVIKTVQKGIAFNYAVGMMLAAILVGFPLRTPAAGGGVVLATPLSA